MPPSEGYKGDASTFVVGVGYVGRRLLNSLPNEASIGLSRSVNNISVDDKKRRVRTLDLDVDEEIGVELPHDYAVVYTVPPARGTHDDQRLQRFLCLLTQVPQRFVYLSTTGVYGDCNGEVVDETATIAPESERAKRRVSAERELRTFSEQNNIELIILRVPGIYGPGRLGIDRLRGGQPVLQDADANPGNRVHVDDLVACCVAALAADVPAGVYNVGDGDDRTSTWFALEVARQLGLDPPPTISREKAEDIFSPRRLSFLRESRRVDVSKMRNTLKPHLRYTDAADGIAASLRENGE